MAIDTKNVPSGNGKTVNKALQPGNVRAKIHDVWFKKEEYAKDRPEYMLYLQLEGEPVGGDWKGFSKVYGDPNSGTFDGPSGRVRASQYNFYDGSSPNGYEQNIQKDVLGFLRDLCEQTGCLEWFQNLDGRFETIALIVDAFNKEKPYRDVFINWCLGAREYKNKAGYPAYDLSVVRSTVGKRGFSADENKVVKYDPAIHLRKQKPKELPNGFDAKPEVKSEGVHTDALKADHAAQQQALKQPDKMPEANPIASNDDDSLPFDL